MVNYKEEITDGSIKKWRRASKVEIRNDYGQTPHIVFNEVEQTILPDGTLMAHLTERLVESMTDINASFDLLNPENDEVIGTATNGQLYAMLYSLYMKLAKERDERVLLEEASLEPTP